MGGGLKHLSSPLSKFVSARINFEEASDGTCPIAVPPCQSTLSPVTWQESWVSCVDPWLVWRLITWNCCQGILYLVFGILYLVFCQKEMFNTRCFNLWAAELWHFCRLMRNPCFQRQEMVVPVSYDNGGVSCHVSTGFLQSGADQ